MKTCSKCGETKAVTEFGKHAQTEDGLKSRCKICHAAESRASRSKHIEGARSRELAYHYANKERRNAQARTRGLIYRDENRERLLLEARTYYAKNRDQIRALQWLPSLENSSKGNAWNGA